MLWKSSRDTKESSDRAYVRGQFGKVRKCRVNGNGDQSVKRLTDMGRYDV